MRFACIVCLGLPVLAFAQDRPPATIERIELHDCGLYESRDATREKDPVSAGGYRRIVKDNKLLKVTDTIPALLGTRFGCGVMLRGAPSGGAATYRAVMHVDAADGTTKEMTGSQTYSIDAEGGYMGMTLRSDGQLKPGRWSLSAWTGSRKMAEWKFIMVKP